MASVISIAGNVLLNQVLTTFDRADVLDKSEGVASFYGPDFYRLPRNSEQITLQRKGWRVPDEVAFVGAGLVPLGAGEEMKWQMA